MEKYILIQIIERESVVLKVCNNFDTAFQEMKTVFLNTLKDKNIVDNNGNEIKEIDIYDNISEQCGFEENSCWLNYRDEGYDWQIHRIYIK